MPPTPSTILKNVFGYERFRPLQLEIIHNILAKKDTLAIMPTGGGKSLCYQIPALIFPGLTVVISPLIALMKDQVEQLHELGVPALFLNSSLSYEDYQANMQQVRSGQIKLLYTSPETLLTAKLFNLLHEIPLDCLTIDEAHCISEWGHDFRPEYRLLADVRNHFPQAVCLALTATATPRVRQDIKACLGFENSNEFVASFNRDNLLIEVLPKSNPAQQSLQFIQRFPNQSGIIYCFSRNQVDELAQFLADKGYAVRPYHAGLSDEERKENQELFIRDRVQIIVATIAFGMGINKPNVRFIIHHDLPKSLESYYQEIGRAGRDGLPAHCLLLYSHNDVRKINYFIDQQEDLQRQVSQEQLEALTRYAKSTVCRRIPLLAYFGEKFSQDNCGMCDICLKEKKDLVDLTTLAQKFLACVWRTGQTFDASHIVEILRGSKSQKVFQYDHHKLSTFGVGKDLSTSQWQLLSRQLILQNLLIQDNLHGNLKLTPKGRLVLKGEQKFFGSLEAEQMTSIGAGKAGELDYDPALFEILRQKRRELADEAHVPPYVIFSDKTLIDMAACYPTSLRSMEDIYGIGKRKLRKYGPVYVAIIARYCKENHISEKEKTTPPKKAIKPKREGIPKHLLVGKAFNAGASIQELADQFGVQSGTIVYHLSQYLLEGHSLRSHDFLTLPDLPDGLQEKAIAAFVSLGAERLKPVFENLGGAVNYDDLRVLRLYYLLHRDEISALELNHADP